MRSHRNENGHTLLVVPREMIGPFRNALQKLAGGIDFFALDAAERDSLDQALRHLWNPGDDAQARDKTVPIDVLAISLRDGEGTLADPLDPPTVRRPASSPGVPASPTRPTTRDRIANAQATAEPRPQEPRPLEARPTVELERDDLTMSAERPERSPRHDGYRAPTKGRHSDVAR